MTPQEKANELMEKAYDACGLYTMTQQCALMVVDEILEAGRAEIVNIYFDDMYWQDVKLEIEKL